MMKMTNKDAAGECRKKNDITFGVELEFLALAPDGESPYNIIYNTLTSKVTLPCKKPGCEQKQHDWYLPIRHHLATESPLNGSTLGEEDRYDGWHVTTDGSLQLYTSTETLPDHILRAPEAMEVVSRVLNFDRPTPCPYGQTYPCTGEPLEWHWREELAVILDTLRKTFDKPGYRLLINGSTGLHVHIGHGFYGLPVAVVKGMLASFSALERVFDTVLTTERISGYDGEMAMPGIDTTGLVYGYDAEVEGGGAFCRALSSIFMSHLQEGIEHHTPVPPWVPVEQEEDEGDHWAPVTSSDEWAADSEEAPWAPTSTPDDWATDNEEAPWAPSSTSDDWATPTEEPAWANIPVTESTAAEDQEVEASPVSESQSEASKQVIRQNLSQLNIPAWLRLIRSSTTITDLKGFWSHHSCKKYSSVNLDHLGDPWELETTPAPVKSTAEIRCHAGSLDIMEIASWVDVLAKLARWSENKGDEAFAYLTNVYADPAFTFVDFAKEVGVEDTTMRHYADVLTTPDYAQRRHDRHVSDAMNPHDDFHVLTRAVEANRLRLARRCAVDQKIKFKLESGRYGQFPSSFLDAVLSKNLLDTERGRFLALDRCDYDAWINFSSRVWRENHGVSLFEEDDSSVEDAV